MVQITDDIFNHADAIKISNEKMDVLHRIICCEAESRALREQIELLQGRSTFLFCGLMTTIPMILYLLFMVA